MDQSMFPLCLTLDFEDIGHDTRRLIGIEDCGPLDRARLEASFQRFSEVAGAHGPATIFCTGVIAHQFPELVRAMADAGHEVACHGYYHDRHAGLGNPAFEDGLIRAKACLEDAAGRAVHGFRAPFFSLRPDQLPIVARHFSYDSSGSSANGLVVRPFEDSAFRVVPVTHIAALSGRHRFKLGGSHLKVMSKSLILRALANASEGEGVPVAYIHPYEILNWSPTIPRLGELRTADFAAVRAEMPRTLFRAAILRKRFTSRLRWMIESTGSRGTLASRLGLD